MKQSGRGRIVNITSWSVREPIPNLMLSNAIRPGVVGWAKALSHELGPHAMEAYSEVKSIYYAT